ncbi:MAG: DUF5615 family PIN-like protein [Thermochromatium sp.]
MKIKLDENLPARLVRVLMDFGHEADTVRDQGLAGLPEEDVWQASQRERRFLITQDLDFSDMRRYLPGTYAGLLLVRMREPKAYALLARTSSVAADLGSWAGCFVVMTDHKVRTKCPRWDGCLTWSLAVGAL